MVILSKTEFNAIIEALMEIKQKVDTDNLALKQSLTSVNEQMSVLMNHVNDLSARMERLEKRLSQIQAPKPIAMVGQTVAKQQDRRQVVEPKPEPKPQSRKFYAVMVGNGSLELYEMDDSDKDSAPFLATVTGNKGTVEFNYSCVSTLLPRASADLLPFFEYDLRSNPPSSIEAVNKANITFDGEKWKMDKPIKIIIT